MIKTSISYGIEEDNRYSCTYIPQNIQLALFKYDLYKNDLNKIINNVNENNININVIHLPLETLKLDMLDAFIMITDLVEKLNCKKFVIHPNAKINLFIKEFISAYRNDAILCVETFQYKKKKELRTAIDIIAAIERYKSPNIRMTLDTTHLEDCWFNYPIMSALLKYTDVIHLSNRQGKKKHIPFNTVGADLNLISFIKDLKHHYKWTGDIVLEYMPEYHYKLRQNLFYIERLLAN